jgi:hypothetical protein
VSHEAAPSGFQPVPCPGAWEGFQLRWRIPTRFTARGARGRWDAVPGHAKATRQGRRERRLTRGRLPMGLCTAAAGRPCNPRSYRNAATLARAVTTPQRRGPRRGPAAGARTGAGPAPVASQGRRRANASQGRHDAATQARAVDASTQARASRRRNASQGRRRGNASQAVAAWSRWDRRGRRGLAGAGDGSASCGARGRAFRSGTVAGAPAGPGWAALESPWSL